ncbi:hypothetical protein DIE15_35640 [Burkholderia sp. Bp9031]|nr:hypothetical protein DIE15_35640 [Burkholderia sp. Bp9031]
MAHRWRTNWLSAGCQRRIDTPFDEVIFPSSLSDGSAVAAPSCRSSTISPLRSVLGASVVKFDEHGLWVWCMDWIMEVHTRDLCANMGQVSQSTSRPDNHIAEAGKPARSGNRGRHANANATGTRGWNRDCL